MKVKTNYPTLLPIDLIIATAHRTASLKKTLSDILEQFSLPTHIFISDSSSGNSTKLVFQENYDSFKSKGCSLVYLDATHCPGAATQRNFAIEYSTQPYVLFCDDDIELPYKKTIYDMWHMMKNHPKIGGLSAHIINQKFTPPGSLTSSIVRLLNKSPIPSNPKQWAGKVIGPTINYLPCPHPEKEPQRVEWLNTTLVLYRQEALPSPVFDIHFTGASHCEDLCLSLRVGKNWDLANTTQIQYFHRSQTGIHKNNEYKHASQEFINRRYIQTQILSQSSMGDLVRLTVMHFYQNLAATWKSPYRALARISGSLHGLFHSILQISRAS